MQRFCEGDGEAVPTKKFEMIKLAPEGDEMKWRNMALSVRYTEMEAGLVWACAVGDTMREQLAGAKR